MSIGTDRAHAIVVHEAGGLEVLRLEEVPDPQPGEGELLVRVEAVGINHIDLVRRAGCRHAPGDPRYRRRRTARRHG
jgi:NADPH:quinone reductase-like Zn-dependent oxidoreductase